MIVSDAPNCGVTYNRHYDDRNSFIIQASGQNLGAEFLTLQAVACVPCIYFARAAHI